ncbi:MAG: hypothetical protein AB7F20_03675 [Geoalkalibacter sp.]|jgi:hypothetical protein|uniref:hypothetical protein n=1 Tax=Geoalkalibacter sp. TaxID=3041440 RepID=UPI002A9CAB36|nr:hypothetical protein [Thermodesulfobacteriota bacterium]
MRILGQPLYAIGLLAALLERPAHLQPALKDKPGMLAMESPFTSIWPMGRHNYPLSLSYPCWLIEVRFDSLSRSSQLDTLYWPLSMADVDPMPSS